MHSCVARDGLAGHEEAAGVGGADAGDDVRRDGGRDDPQLYLKGAAHLKQNGKRQGRGERAVGQRELA